MRAVAMRHGADNISTELYVNTKLESAAASKDHRRKIKNLSNIIKQKQQQKREKEVRETRSP